MEQYSIDGRGRGEVYIVLAILAISLAYAAKSVEHLLPFGIPWWVEFPSFAVWFGLVNVLYDRWLWRFQLGGLRFSPVPDFSGHWHGKIVAVSTSKQQEEMPVDVTIRQTWSSMEIRGKTLHGVTRSKLVGVRIEDGELRYEYETQPDIFDPNAKHHTGFCVLELLDNDLLEGFYYTLDGTSAKGGIKLERSHAPQEHLYTPHRSRSNHQAHAAQSDPRTPT